MNIEPKDIERQKQIEAMIERRRLARHGISDDEWQDGLNKEYQDQMQLQSMMNQI